MTTTYFSHPECDLHTTPQGHPEQVARLKAVRDALDAPPFSTLDRRDAPLGAETDIARCHPQDYIDRIKAAIAEGVPRSLDADTHVCAGSLNAALRGVGGVVAAVNGVLDGHYQNAFVACRPPGHHAEKATAMGFCLFGNVSIAAKYALEMRGLSRVAVIDFDVHHGNGTQDVLWDEKRCLFASSHEMPLYPGSGAANETGAHGNILNVPLASQSDGSEMRRVYEEAVFPTVEAFDPELILVSAGFDAHRDDPLASLSWTEDDFVWITQKICELADKCCDGRVVSSLEGGYDLAALGSSVAAHVGVLMGLDR